jgi:putative transposase
VSSAGPGPHDAAQAQEGRSKDSSPCVIEVLAELFAEHGPPKHLRSDNGPEFTAHLVRRWLARVGVQTLFIQPGSPWENGYVESFNGKLRDEFLKGEIFYTLHEAVVLVEQWRRLYNTVRPHSMADYPPPRRRLNHRLGSSECPNSLDHRWLKV